MSAAFGFLLISPDQPLITAMRGDHPLWSPDETMALAATDAAGWAEAYNVVSRLDDVRAEAEEEARSEAERRIESDDGGDVDPSDLMPLIAVVSVSDEGRLRIAHDEVRRLSEAAGSEDAETLMSRSLSGAVYEPEDVFGAFGIAFRKDEAPSP